MDLAADVVIALLERSNRLGVSMLSVTPAPRATEICPMPCPKREAAPRTKATRSRITRQQVVEPPSNWSGTGGRLDASDVGDVAACGDRITRPVGIRASADDRDIRRLEKLTTGRRDGEAEGTSDQPTFSSAPERRDDQRATIIRRVTVEPFPLSE